MSWGLLWSPIFFLFASISVGGAFIAIMSSGVLGVWLGLELGFFGFLPIMNGKTMGENEATIKYFIIQSLGSAFILVGFLLMDVGYKMFYDNFTMGLLVDVTMLMGFMVKLGVFPFHFWFPSVMSGVSWFSCFWLGVIQKLGPFWGVSGLGMGEVLCQGFIVSLILTSLVGAMGGLAQVQFRPLLAYSSLNQTGWMGLVVLISPIAFLYYMGLYSLLLGGLLVSLHLVNSYSIYELPGWDMGKGLWFWILMGSFFLSLGGLPPLVGAVLKLAGAIIIVSKYPLFLGILIGTSMISLYYYLSIFINSAVGLGGSRFGTYDLGGVTWKDVIILVSFSGLNWFGGLPVFIFCGGLVG